MESVKEKSINRVDVPVLFLSLAVNRCKLGANELTRFSGVPFCKLVMNSSRSETRPEVLKATAMMHARISRIRKEDVWNLFRDLYIGDINSARLLSSFQITLRKTPFVHSPIHSPILPSIHQFIYLSIYLSIYPTILRLRSFQKRDIYSLILYVSTFRLFPVQISLLLCSKYFLSLLFVLILFFHVAIFYLYISDILLQKRIN